MFQAIMLFAVAVGKMVLAFTGRWMPPVEAALAVAMFVGSIGHLESFEPDTLVLIPDGRTLRSPLTWDRRTRLDAQLEACVWCAGRCLRALAFALMVSGYGGFPVFAIRGQFHELQGEALGCG